MGKDAISVGSTILSMTAGHGAKRSRPPPPMDPLVAGYDADVNAIDGDPLADIDLLGDPDAVTTVWEGGVKVRG